MEFLDQSKLINWLGILTLIKFTWWFSARIFHILRLYLDSCSFQETHLMEYGEWALVTGSSEGIGKALAIELAKSGLNILLISYVEEDLRNTAIEIGERYGVETSYIVADFRNRDCYKRIEKEIEAKDIGILVNNVGMVQSSPFEYCYYKEEAIWSEIDVNCGTIAQMTRMILPKMKAKKKGMVVNLGSLTVLAQQPYLGIYTAAKTFVTSLSATLQMEMKEFNIKFRCFNPSWTDTNMTKNLKPVLDQVKRVAPFLLPDARSFAESVVASLKRDFLFSTGYWSHSVIELFMEILPQYWRNKVAYFEMKYIAHKVSKNKFQMRNQEESIKKNS